MGRCCRPMVGGFSYREPWVAEMIEAIGVLLSGAVLIGIGLYQYRKLMDE